MSVAVPLHVIGELKHHALEYAAKGFAVFPVAPYDGYEWAPGRDPKGAKTPIVSQYQATTDLEKIEQWWTRWPDALIGHRVAPEHLIIDIDPRHNGGATWKLLRDELGMDYPATRIHVSGRNDGGGHIWYRRPAERITISKLDDWAEEHGTGHKVADADRWVCGLDLLHHTHRYTILPPSPHPVTREPYQWHQWTDVAEMPDGLAALIIDDSPPPEPYVPKEYDGDSIADWFSAKYGVAEILYRHGWTLRRGTGNEDGSLWRHPTASSPISASVRHGCLFVYSPNTPFEMTEEGKPEGYTPFRVFTILDHGGDASAAAKAARELKGPEPRTPTVDLGVKPPPLPPINLEAPEVVAELDEADHLPVPIHWETFWKREAPDEDWLCEPLLARGRQTALFAAAKVGKSLLMLEVAAALATGRPALSHAGSEPIDVVYADYEMTEDDLHERLESLGYGPHDDLSHLHYYLLPTLAPLNTDVGGQDFVTICERHGAQAAVIDTFGRALEGEENANDTYLEFYRYCGLRLKQRGIALARLDHAGKDAAKGQRGGSAKDGDVDIVWSLEPMQDGVRMKRTRARMSWVPEQVALRRVDDGRLRHLVIETGGYLAGTQAMVELLERHGIPMSASSRAAGKALRAAGETGADNVIRSAQKFRKNSVPEFHPPRSERA